MNNITELEHFVLLIAARLNDNEHVVRFKHTNKGLKTVTRKKCRVYITNNKTYNTRFLTVSWYGDHEDGLGEILQHAEVDVKLIKHITINEKGKVTIKAVNRWVNNDNITLEII